MRAQEARELLADCQRLGKHPLVDDGGRQHGDDAHHRPVPDRHGGPVRGEQPVVVQPVGVVPQALVVHGLGDGGEVLEELQDQAVRRPPAAALQGDGDGGHGDRVEGHPAGGVGLLQDSADRQVRAIDRADVVQPHEAALEQVVAFRVLQVDPPGEVDQQLVEDLAEEVEVAAAVDGEHLQRGPGLHRRVHVAEVPLVGGQRPVRVLEPLPAQQDQLVLGERRVHVREGDAVEGQVPGREPRVLPLVRHRHQVEGIEVAPFGVAPALPLRRGRRLGGVTVEPAGHVVVVQLLAPQHPGEGLPHHHRLVRLGPLRASARRRTRRPRPGAV